MGFYYNIFLNDYQYLKEFIEAPEILEISWVSPFILSIN